MIKLINLTLLSNIVSLCSFRSPTPTAYGSIGFYTRRWLMPIVGAEKAVTKHRLYNDLLCYTTVHGVSIYQSHLNKSRTFCRYSEGKLSEVIKWLIVSFLGLVLINTTIATELPQVYTHWESFYKEDGLPSNKVFCVAVDENRVWFGTDNGLACYENGTWATYNVEDGLAYKAIISIAVDPATRNVWVGTMGGLTRISAGRFDTFTQFNSGLPNDVVFGVTVENQNVWVATTSGEARFRVRENAWDVYTPANSPQHEPWGYAIDYNDGKVWAALWGGGVLEFDVATERWKDYLDPDGEMEIDLFRDDGIIHVITTAVSYREGILWASTYFGLSRYDGTRWRGYMDHDTGLVSNFINFVKARERTAWVCTDKGLSVINGDKNRWVTYTPIHGPMEGDKGWEARVFHENELLETHKLPQGLANNFVLGVDFQGDDVWIATSKGVSRGTLEKK